MDARVTRTREWLQQIEALGLWRPRASAERVLAEASELPPPEPEPATVVHGDLHFRHVLVDGNRLVAVIDWGDVCRADPAVDLQLYWSLLPPAARPELLRAYGPVAEERLLRARVLALCLCAALAAYARDRGFAGVEREALDGLARTLVD
jgi:aminoglycoside phosphotransferase (APT) family kinase protein